MWDMARRMGFDGGRVLEPSMGVGNFFAMMPKDLKEASSLTGIELDKLTARMAKVLYPQANINQKGYEESKTPDDFYDLIISNVPFANVKPADSRYDKLRASIHNYFFAKAIDQVKPGGLVMFLTTNTTMDSKGKATRRYVDDKADLVAAFRFPSGAFQRYAGTKGDHSLFASLIHSDRLY
jgi:adenine-specific DNA methylase